MDTAAGMYAAAGVIFFAFLFYVLFPRKKIEPQREERERPQPKPCPQGQVLKDTKCEPAVVNSEDTDLAEAAEAAAAEAAAEAAAAEKQAEEAAAAEAAEEERKNEEDGVCECKQKHVWGSEPGQYGCLVEQTEDSIEGADKDFCIKKKTRTSCINVKSFGKKTCNWIPN